MSLGEANLHEFNLLVKNLHDSVSTVTFSCLFINLLIVVD